MITLLAALIFLGAAALLVSAAAALRAWLRFRRTRRELQGRLLDEVASVTGRIGELERNLGSLERRAGSLPVRVAELQQSLATLRLLSGTLSISLRQLQRALSPSGLKLGLSGYLATLSRGRRTG
ncbi:hypothetical protein RxyAA322_14720 [Rubrobacter xylanophilus]|uniref:Uncharacterized protein n=2 Tax=Rubrobacter xylanophilus TaxID=49319 RepID=A0A510HI78_9ACTN|nr:hypothetical protein RxyAA322_14720 [Rubrobacter xylanophilus]